MMVRYFVQTKRTRAWVLRHGTDDKLSVVAVYQRREVAEAVADALNNALPFEVTP